MTKNTKPLAKSLHTVTVLVRVARNIQATVDPQATPRQALSEAVVVLGLANKPDPYGLREAALKQLEAEAK